MALAHFRRPVQDAAGNLITSGTCTVRRESAGAPLQVCYSDRDGTSSLGSSVAWTGGVLDFYVVGGAYRLQGVGNDGSTFDWRYQGIGTGSEVDANTLLTPGYLMQWETGTSAPPSSGCVRANHATWTSATTLYISETTSGGSDWAARLNSLVAGDTILITFGDGAQVTAGVISNTDSGAYRTMGTTAPAGTLPASPAGAVTVQLLRLGTSTGTQMLPIPAASWVPTITNGARRYLAEDATNDLMEDSLLFDPSTQQFATYDLTLPKKWNAGTITFVPRWRTTGGSASQTVVWALSAVAISNDDALDAAPGTAQTSSDTWIADSDLHVGPESSAVTIAGSPAKGDTIRLKIQRNVASDDLAVDARLVGIDLYLTTDAMTDA